MGRAWLVAGPRRSRLQALQVGARPSVDDTLRDRRNSCRPRRAPMSMPATGHGFEAAAGAAGARGATGG